MRDRHGRLLRGEEAWQAARQQVQARNDAARDRLERERTEHDAARESRRREGLADRDVPEPRGRR